MTVQRVCAHQGCQNGLDTGHALHRVSPKGPGMPFVGLCTEHHPDPNIVAVVFEQANHAAPIEPPQHQEPPA